MVACEKDAAECLRLLIEHGADLDVKNSDGKTALLIAAKKGRAECVSQLVAAGVKLNETDRIGKTATMWAAAMGHVQCVSHLAAQADLSIRDQQGKSSMLVACEHGPCWSAAVGSTGSPSELPHQSVAAAFASGCHSAATRPRGPCLSCAPILSQAILSA